MWFWQLGLIGMTLCVAAWIFWLLRNSSPAMCRYKTDGGFRCGLSEGHDGPHEIE